MNVDRNATKLALSDLKGTSGELNATLSAAEFIRIPTEIVLVKDVNYRLNYQLVEDNFKIQLECVGKFEAECQRCLEKFTFSEKVEVSGSLPFDKLKKTADGEFLLYENGEVDLVKTLEDEFLKINFFF